MKVLHLLRSIDDERAMATARSHAREQAASLVLLQDAVLGRVEGFAGPVYACAEDTAARGKGGEYTEIDYEGIVRLLFEHDRVIVW